MKKFLLVLGILCLGQNVYAEFEHNDIQIPVKIAQFTDHENKFSCNIVVLQVTNKFDTNLEIALDQELVSSIGGIQLQNLMQKYNTPGYAKILFKNSLIGLGIALALPLAVAFKFAIKDSMNSTNTEVYKNEHNRLMGYTVANEIDFLREIELIRAVMASFLLSCTITPIKTVYNCWNHHQDMQSLKALPDGFFDNYKIDVLYDQTVAIEPGKSKSILIPLRKSVGDLLENMRYEFKDVVIDQQEVKQLCISN